MLSPTLEIRTSTHGNFSGCVTCSRGLSLKHATAGSDFSIPAYIALQWPNHTFTSGCTELFIHIAISKSQKMFVECFFLEAGSNVNWMLPTPFRQVHILTHKSQNSACAPLMSSLGGGHTQDVPPYIQESSSNTGSVSSKSFLSRELYTSAKKGSPWRKAICQA